MLQAIREGAQGFFSWVILILITVPFALWGINNYFGDGKELAVVTVNGKEFLQSDIRRAVQPLKERFNEALQAGLVGEEELKKQAIEGLVLQELQQQEASQRKMTVSDAVVRQNIKGIEVFQTNKAFDKKRYENLLSTKGLSSRGFSEQIRRSKVIEQLQKGVSDSAFLSDRVVSEFYRLRNQERKLSYFVVPVEAEAGTKASSVSEEEIASYYQTHSNQFQTAEKLSVDYIELSLAELMDDVSVDSETLLAAYEEQKNSFMAEEKRSVSHILFIIEDSADASSVNAAKEKAQKAKAQLVAGKDFGELAKALSDDSATAEKGGELGFIERGMMDKAFEEAAYQLSDGAISEPIRSQYGFHLIKLNSVEAKEIKPFQTVKVELLASLKRQAAEDLLYEKMEQMAEAAFEASDSLEPVAELLGLKIQESGLFTRDKGEGVADDPRVRSLAFSDEVLNNRNSEPLEISADRAIVLRLKSREEAGSKPLDEVHDEILAQINSEKTSEKADAVAKELFQKLKAGTKIIELAASNSVELLSPEAVTRDDKVLPPELLAAVFKAQHPANGKPLPLRIKSVQGEQIIAVLESVTDGDSGKVESGELEMAKEFLTKAAGEGQLEAYLLSLRSRAEVKVSSPSEE
jgi:peptidyl-prolyl cis-trans isomerase D